MFVKAEATMTERKSLSKKVRFEIFKRDGFTCQYCGKQPPDSTLVIDHINPIANGGDNDMLNLITSCEDCNQGKGARLLERITFSPDADIEWLETQQEIAEMRRYQIAKAERDRLQDEIIESLQNLWWELVNDDDAPSKTVFIRWFGFAAPDEIEKAIIATSAKSYKLTSFRAALKYCSACIRNIVEGN